jgi:two-component system sensor histidine kinase DesK
MPVATRREGRRPYPVKPVTWLIISGVWLGYLFYPISAFVTRPHPLGIQVLAVLALGAFVTVYLLAWRNPPACSDRERLAWAAALVGIALGAYVMLHLPDALGGIVYAGPLLGQARIRAAAIGAAVVTLITVATWRWAHFAPGLLLTILVPFYAVAIAMQAYSQFWRMGMRLHLAEQELRTLAINNARLAVARDLHDLVGHSLSAIALRADLAAQQASNRAPEAAQEMGQVAQMARAALHDVRTAVREWRAVSLREEWAQAAVTLHAAGIRTEATGLEQSWPPDVDRALGFWIREGTTNILRHSTATQCRLTVHVETGRIRASLEDNGRPRAEPHPQAGSGIAGLRERMAALGGTVTAQSTPTGFVLEAILPLVWRNPASNDGHEMDVTADGLVEAGVDGA